MKLAPLTPTHRLNIEMKSWSRRLRIREVIAITPRREKLIIVGNGSPDNLVLMVLAYHLNHKIIK